MINEEVTRTPERRKTRAEQRSDTRRRIVEATVACLVEDGYGALTTRRVAERARIAQSTVMHHFATREALLVDAISNIAVELANRSLAQIDLAGLRRPEHREAVLDQTWREFTSPQALAAAEVWVAAWNEPELALTMQELEARIGAILATNAAALFPELAADARFPAMIDIAVSLIRGLVLAIPIWGQEAVDRRWEEIKPVLLQAAAQLLARAGS